MGTSFHPIAPEKKCNFAALPILGYVFFEGTRPPPPPQKKGKKNKERKPERTVLFWGSLFQSVAKGFPLKPTSHSVDSFGPKQRLLQRRPSVGGGNDLQLLSGFRRSVPFSFGCDGQNCFGIPQFGE